LRIEVVYQLEDEKSTQKMFLESVVPLNIEQVHEWVSSGVSDKDLWMTKRGPIIFPGELGRPTEGQIFGAWDLSSGERKQIWDVVAISAISSAVTDQQYRIPWILYAKVKDKLSADYFRQRMDLDKDQEKRLKKILKAKVWVPMAMEMDTPVDQKDSMKMVEVLEHTRKFTEAYFRHRDPRKVDWPLFESHTLLQG